MIFVKIVRLHSPQAKAQVGPLFFFFFLRIEKGDSRVAIIVSFPIAIYIVFIYENLYCSCCTT